MSPAGIAAAVLFFVGSWAVLLHMAFPGGGLLAPLLPAAPPGATARPLAGLVPFPILATLTVFFGLLDRLPWAKLTMGGYTAWAILLVFGHGTLFVWSAVPGIVFVWIRAVDERRAGGRDGARGTSER